MFAILALALDIARLLQAGAVAGERLVADGELRTFYARREGRPAWDAPSTGALIRALQGLDDHGLDPAHYHLPALVRLSGGAERDVLATDAFLTAASHLSLGRVDPQFARPPWCAPPPRLDLPAVLQAVLDDGTIEETLAGLAPRHEEYGRLREAMRVYRSIVRSGGWSALPSGPALRPGMKDPRVAALRHRLAGEPFTLAAQPVVTTVESALFDPELEGRVRHFQAHHGITVDGVVGRETLRELNVPAAERVLQIAVNLERWRWMPEDPGAVYAIVNIAAFRLDVFERGRPALSMKTVVGKEYTRTPFFAARIGEVLLNPWWNVPDSIAAKELWPKQRRDRSYFARNHMIVSQGRIRQRPGPWNSLGRIKFNMPNRHNVYLHDTPARELFEQPFRAFSHGCIRLERPLDLALYLLRDQPQWDAPAIQSTIDAGTERTIPLKTPLPVYVLYWTAWVGDDGHMEFHRDHYERDAAIAVALTHAQE